MEYCVAFNDRELCISFLVFKPMVMVEDLFLEALKKFSFFTKNHGCIQSSVLKSIHGNMVKFFLPYKFRTYDILIELMIIWCGTWTKSSIQNTELLSEALLQNLTNISNMATLMDLNFFEAYGGESIDSAPVAKFLSKNIVSMISVVAKCGDINDLSYGCLAIFKSRFQKMEGVTSGICLKSHNTISVISLYVWNSPFHCYSWILNSDHIKSMLPYLDRFSLCVKYDIFQVVNVSDFTNIPKFEYLVPQHLLDNDEQKRSKSCDVK